MTLPSRAATPVMIAIGGMSGSGKSTLAEELGARMPDVVVLDSDVVRKELYGVDPRTPLPLEAYSPESTKKFIRHIHRKAQKELKAGRSVIVTGLFLDKHTREKQEFLARRNDAEFIGIYLHASASLLFERVAKRTNTASDADRMVLRRQFKTIPPKPFHELNWHIINADQTMESMTASAMTHIRRQHHKIRMRPPEPKKTQRKQHPSPKPPH